MWPMKIVKPSDKRLVQPLDEIRSTALGAKTSEIPETKKYGLGKANAEGATIASAVFDKLGS